tara:strand:+ start:33 stop:461 length:429 start_codon:yes stop_codon:yes gene_type:complete
MTKKKILIMGLPGSGKTSLAKRLYPYLKAVFLNNDEVRKEANDWDFSPKGRERQTKRMKDLAQKYLNEGKNVIADFVCPTEKTRKDFNADILIWVDTIKKGRFEDTNKMFEEPKKFHYRVTEQNAEKWSLQIIEDMKNKGFI